VIIADARLLLIDEMSLGLSPSALAHLLETVKQLNEMKGTTTLLVEQNATAALSIASRGYVLDTGRVVAEGPAGDLAPRMAQLYLGRPGYDLSG
jgi:branched-chain amino acid transport system ATP-binding protein